MAIQARIPFPRVRPGVNRELMGEAGTRPEGCRVTRLTGFRKTGRHMVGIRNGVVHAAMAGVTIHRGAGKSAANVTVCALHARMLAGQSKARARVVEHCAAPLARVVTQLAILRESCGDMVGVCRRVEPADMATRTSGVEAGVTSTNVTCAARGRRVRAGERKTCARMVEHRTRPSRCRVTQRAIAWEAGGGVIRIRCPVVDR
jgi:hypothetical protein